jgi:DNA-binding NarL/FixJ family response regulator
VIGVIIADPLPIFRRGLANVLAAEDDVRIMALPRSPAQLLNALMKLQPHVIILSTSWSSCLPKVREISSRDKVAVLMLAEVEEHDSAFMQMRIQGVIYRSSGAKVFVDAVRRLARGQPFSRDSSAAKADIIEDYVGIQVRKRLSVRELQIVRAVVQGYKNGQIALELNTSEQMIKKALHVIFQKVGVYDRLELALFVVHHCILAEDAASGAVVPTP